MCLVAGHPTHQDIPIHRVAVVARLWLDVASSGETGSVSGISPTSQRNALRYSCHLTGWLQLHGTSRMDKMLQGFWRRHDVRNNTRTCIVQQVYQISDCRAQELRQEVVQQHGHVVHTIQSVIEPARVQTLDVMILHDLSSVSTVAVFAMGSPQMCLHCK